MDYNKTPNQIYVASNPTDFINALNNKNISRLDLIFCFKPSYFTHCFRSLENLIKQLQVNYTLSIYNFTQSSWAHLKDFTKFSRDFTPKKEFPKPILKSPSSNILLLSDFILPSALCCLSGKFSSVFPMLLPVQLPSQSKRFSMRSLNTSPIVIEGGEKFKQLALINKQLSMHQIKLARYYASEIFCLS